MDYADKALRYTYSIGYHQGGIDALELVLAVLKDSPHKFHTAAVINTLLKQANEAAEQVKANGMKEIA